MATTDKYKKQLRQKAIRAHCSPCWLGGQVSTAKASAAVTGKYKRKHIIVL